MNQRTWRIANALFLTALLLLPMTALGATGITKREKKTGANTWEDVTDANPKDEPQTGNTYRVTIKYEKRPADPAGTKLCDFHFQAKKGALADGALSIANLPAGWTANQRPNDNWINVFTGASDCDAEGKTDGQTLTYELTIGNADGLRAVKHDIYFTKDGNDEKNAPAGSIIGSQRLSAPTVFALTEPADAVPDADGEDPPVAGVPTLSEWGLMLMVGAFLAAGVFAMRRR